VVQSFPAGLGGTDLPRLWDATKSMAGSGGNHAICAQIVSKLWRDSFLMWRDFMFSLRDMRNRATKKQALDGKALPWGRKFIVGGLDTAALACWFKSR
jgi:hypothetical protein